MYVTLFILFLIAFVCMIFCHFRRKKIICRVKCMDKCQKCSMLEELAAPFGYVYHCCCGFFSSTIDAWQKAAGYTWFYDYMAPRFQMVFDALPVYFDYQKKTWLIEFWKGQYGINTGAEIGIYHADRLLSEAEYQVAHFAAADEHEMLSCSLHLCETDGTYVQISEKHWWLTAFFLGRYCPPYTLTADVSIGFPDYEMCNAYIEGLKQAGYTPSNISRYLRTVAVTFALPRTRQPFSQNSAVARLRLCLNRLCCFLYRHLTGGYSSTLDRLEFLAALSPVLFRLALRFANVRKRYHRYHRTKESSHVHRKPFE